MPFPTVPPVQDSEDCFPGRPTRRRFRSPSREAIPQAAIDPGRTVGDPRFDLIGQAAPSGHFGLLGITIAGQVGET